MQLLSAQEDPTPLSKLV